jgi:hypothetical protein
LGNSHALLDHFSRLRAGLGLPNDYGALANALSPT